MFLNNKLSLPWPITLVVPPTNIAALVGAVLVLLLAERIIQLRTELPVASFLKINTLADALVLVFSIVKFLPLFGADQRPSKLTYFAFSTLNIEDVVLPTISGAIEFCGLIVSWRLKANPGMFLKFIGNVSPVAALYTGSINSKVTLLEIPAADITFEACVMVVKSPNAPIVYVPLSGERKTIVDVSFVGVVSISEFGALVHAFIS